MFLMFDTLEGYVQPGTIEAELVQKIDFSQLPVHIAIIMDGNGRWARNRNLPAPRVIRLAASRLKKWWKPAPVSGLST